MNMKINNKLRLFGLLMALMAGGALDGQELKMNGFAGEDQTVYFTPCEATPFIEITLGSNDPGTTNANCVFSWRVVDAPENARYELQNSSSNKPTLKVYHTGDYVMLATRVSLYGYQTETVCVSFLSEISLFSATPLNDCWEDGDEVNASDFELITNPPGFGYLVEVDERDRVIGESAGFWYGNTEIRFRIKDLDNDNYRNCEVTAEIYVSRGERFDFSSSTIKELGENWGKLKDLKRIIEQSKSKVDRFTGIIDMIKEITPPLEHHFEPDYKKDIDLNMGIYQDCCEVHGKKEPIYFLGMSGSLDLYAGIQFRLPLYPKIPKFGLDLVGSLGAGVSFDGGWKLTLPEYADCYSIELVFGAYGELNIGVEASALDPDVLSVEAHFYGKVEGESKIAFIPKTDFSFEGVTVSSGLSASVSFIGFNKELLNLSFGKWPLIDSYDF